MAPGDGNFNILLNQSLIDLGGDPTELGPCFEWNRQNQRHQRILTGLGARVSSRTPLRLIYEKKLTKTDVNHHHNRFVIGKHSAEESIFRCLTLDQRLRVSNEETVPLIGHDPNGGIWDLKFKLWKQASNYGSMTYVLLGQWDRMVSQNGWKMDDQVSIWGFPYAGVKDGWQFGPDHGYNEVHFLFTV